MKDSLIHTALSNDQITSKIPNCSFVPYEDLHQYTSLKQLLPTRDHKVLLLYQLEKVGHFCCLFYNNEGLQCFDSLAFRPDDPLDLVSPKYVKSKHQDFSYLLGLLLQSKVPVIWSPYRLQKHKTSTCGHWCTIRMLWWSLYCDDFAHCFTHMKDRDRAVAIIFKNLKSVA